MLVMCSFLFLYKWNTNVFSNDLLLITLAHLRKEVVFLSSVFVFFNCVELFKNYEAFCQYILIFWFFYPTHICEFRHWFTFKFITIYAHQITRNAKWIFHLKRTVESDLFCHIKIITVLREQTAFALPGFLYFILKFEENFLQTNLILWIFWITANLFFFMYTSASVQWASLDLRAANSLDNLLAKNYCPAVKLLCSSSYRLLN